MSTSLDHLELIEQFTPEQRLAVMGQLVRHSFESKRSVRWDRRSGGPEAGGWHDEGDDRSEGFAISIVETAAGL